MVSPRYGSQFVDTARLAEPLRFQPSGRVVKNRLMKAPMGEGLASWHPTALDKRGIPTEDLVKLYERWGRGEHNWGMIVTGNVETDFQHIAAAADMTITPACRPEGPRFDMFQKLAAAGRKNGSLMIAQITHPGRRVQRRFSPLALAPSEVEFASRSSVQLGAPHAVTQAEIDALVEGFAHAAAYLEQAGFDGIQLHAAHGYLISQFLSRITNRRTDAYGGPAVAPRLHFLTDIVTAIRARVSPGFVVGAKLNAVEFQDGGVTAPEAAQFCQRLAALGVDFVDLSGGMADASALQWTRAEARRREAFFLKWAEVVTAALRPAAPALAVYLTGGLRSAEAMVRARSVVDGVSLARPAAAEPSLCADLLAGRVTGAIQPAGNEFENSLSAGQLLAMAQMAQMGDGMVPLDPSDEAAMAVLKEDIRTWQQKSAEDGDKLEFVYPPRYSGP